MYTGTKTDKVESDPYLKLRATSSSSSNGAAPPVSTVAFKLLADIEPRGRALLNFVLESDPNLRPTADKLVEHRGVSEESVSYDDSERQLRTELESAYVEIERLNDGVAETKNEFTEEKVSREEGKKLVNSL